MRGEDLAGRTLSVVPEFRDSNPRRPFTHGWLALEVLRKAGGSALTFEEYDRRLFDPDAEIARLAEQIKGAPNAYQDLKHIRCDLYRRSVVAYPPLSHDWYVTQRCSPGTKELRLDPLLEVATVGEEVGDTYFEGAVARILVNAYERNPSARAKCIQHYGPKCVVCAFSFESQYGSIGDGFIHVHHINPVSKSDGSKYEVDPVKDLRPVCPNCHAMLHRVNPPLTVEDLRTRLPGDTA